MQKLTKKTARELSSLINSLLVNDKMVKDDIRTFNYEAARDSMRWFNREADKLIAAGIEVTKYNTENL